MILINLILILINILLIPKYQIFILLANWKKVWIFHNYFLIKKRDTQTNISLKINL